MEVGDRMVMKKTHPCGGNTFVLLRTGMDFRLKCENCGHEVMIPRTKCEKNIKHIIKPNPEEEGTKNV